jgi:sugar phosphate isomerase/epimerase
MMQARWPALAPDAAAGGSAPSGAFLSCRPSSFGSAADDAYRHLASWGVRYVEIALPDPAEVEGVRQALAAHGMRCGSLQVPFDPEDDGAVAAMEGAARRAREEFGVRFLFTSAHSGRRGREHAYAMLRAAGDAVGRHGVTLLLETHPDLGTNGAVAAATMRAVDHPHVRTNWDPANVFYYNEHCDPVAEFEQALPFIGGLHLKDSGGGYRAWDFGALGDGVVPFRYLLRRLTETGFQGPCTMEIEGIQGERLSPEEYVARVHRSVDYLRNLGYFPPLPA